MKNTLIVFFLLLQISAQSVAQERSLDSLLSVIESAYNSGQYVSSELEARRMFELSGLNDSVKVQLEKWVAFSLIAQGKSSAAKDRFVALLQRDDSFELDPVFTSPKILSVFNDARVTFVTMRKLMSADSLHQINRQSFAENRGISFRTIVFPGWEQIHCGRTETGYWLLGAGIISLTSGAACEVFRANTREEYLKATTTSEITSRYNSYNTFRKAEVYSLAAFAVIYVLSEVDVFLNTDVTFEPTYSSQGSVTLQLSLKF
ncbi:MAG: hypothetical protein WCX28_14465 [Bacteriovoracaceae bacterium]|nr:hypothetical protein [Bacteroidota bacterium]